MPVLTKKGSFIPRKCGGVAGDGALPQTGLTVTSHSPDTDGKHGSLEVAAEVWAWPGIPYGTKGVVPA